MNRRDILKKSVAACAATVFGHQRVLASTANEHVVHITNFKYEPESLDVRVGDIVTWINDDIIPHTATAEDGDWSTEELKHGQSETITVTSDMSNSYYCAYHTHMKASVMLKP